MSSHRTIRHLEERNIEARNRVSAEGSVTADEINLLIDAHFADKLIYTFVHSRGVIADELAGGLDAGHQQRATENATAEKRDRIDPHRNSPTKIIRQKDRTISRMPCDQQIDSRPRSSESAERLHSSDA
jgi:hypothetical protein